MWAVGQAFKVLSVASLKGLTKSGLHPLTSAYCHSVCVSGGGSVSMLMYGVGVCECVCLC